MTRPLVLFALAVILIGGCRPAAANAQDDCRIDCTPRDDRARLQSIIDSCPSGSLCELPDGGHTIQSPLQVRKSLRIRGAGRGRRTRPGARVTEIRVIDGANVPAFVIEGDEPRIDVSIQDVTLAGGGIHAGGPKDPCRGIDDPFDAGVVNLTLVDLAIEAASTDAIRFEGGSLVVQDVTVAGTLAENALHVANALGDIVAIDAEFVGNKGWGVYVCNRQGTGQIFMDDVSASSNGRGGIAIVGKGSPPDFRTACVQNTGAAFNYRFGILLFDVAKTLLFNVSAGLTFSEAPAHTFGDGIAVSASDDVYLWNATASLNNRAGFAVFGPSATQATHIHMVGQISALDNGINAAVDGYAVFDGHTWSTPITGLCGFPETDPPVAPPVEMYCEEDLLPVNCAAIAVSLAPPDPTP